jgi:hypothetical protein
MQCMEDDNGSGSGQRLAVAAMAAAMAVAMEADNGGEELLIWLKDEILISTYFCSVPA